MDAGADSAWDERRRSLLDDLLVTALRRAVSIEEVDDVALLVAEDLAGLEP